MESPNLSPMHQTILESVSSISPDVIAARGYRSIEKKADLKQLSFGESQRIVPTLLIPIWGVNGEVALYHHRPDEPRILDGKPAKYEFPSGKRMVVDVHPSLKEKVRDPSVPLFITEGVKKADSAISRGLCCIAVVGTWNWRGTNEFGGKTALPDWDGIALKDGADHGRQVYIVYDSDVMLKPQVRQALVRLSGFLKQRGANVAYILLPPGEGGTKTGLDDFFAAGNFVDDLMRCACAELPGIAEESDEAASAIPYVETRQGLIWQRPAQGGSVPVLLTNFTARIVRESIENDGAETRRLFSMEANLNGRSQHFAVPAPVFAAMNWPAEHLGAGAILYPGQSVREHTRTAIQTLSQGAPQQQVRTHTGWVRSGDEGTWVFCHAGGVIGTTTADAITVRLDDGLDRFVLPEPLEGEERLAAVRASLQMLEVGNERLIFPLLAAIFRAVLGAADFSIFLVGPTGVFKSELAALAQQHFGSGLDARHLPGSWTSTDNALEGLAFLAKDTLLVIDDFAPTGSGADVQRLHAKAERILRAQGNNSARARMRADSTLRPPKPPRGLILSTGEDVPRGQSVRGRALILEVSPGDVNQRLLSERQNKASGGLYAQAMAAFIAWLAPRYEEVVGSLRANVERLRDKVGMGGQHNRTPEIVANLVLGLEMFTRFAHEAGALTREEAEALLARGTRAIQTAAASQAKHLEDSEPTRRFRDLIAAALAAGKAHIAAPNGEAPPNAQAFGWRKGQIGQFSDGGEWHAQGDRIGWVDGNDLYLIPEAALACAKRMAGENGEGIMVNSSTLHKRLNEKGLLVSIEKTRGTLTVRKTLGGARREVLHLNTCSIVCQESDQSDQTDLESLA